ncbi:regulator of microtubule dynamics protein 1-like [Haliotis cracherodii]|uniref:regulator of microtubule dynamics protein 1-like n=1 Tax=Haliotis cracherodii TaxID=6455 RepID=UPI0039E7D75A
MAAPSEKLMKLLPLIRDYARSFNGTYGHSLRERNLSQLRTRGNKIGKTAAQLHCQPKRPSSCTKLPLVFIPGMAVVKAVSFGFGNSAPAAKESPPSNPGAAKTQTIIAEADRLYEDNDPIQLYNYLIQFKDIENDGILWRLARAACDKGKLLGRKDKTQRRVCVYEAFEYAKKALALNKENFACHKWYAILLDYTGEYEGMKQRISNAYTVKEHFLKAIELNPRDSTSMYSVGYWCYAFADLAWYQRNIAAALFASPPKSTYEEALGYFQKAEEVDPGFYSMNLVMLGRTYMHLGKPEPAAQYLKMAIQYPVKTADDEQAHKEAQELLKKLGVKQ